MRETAKYLSDGRRKKAYVGDDKGLSKWGVIKKMFGRDSIRIKCRCTYIQKTDYVALDAALYFVTLFVGITVAGFFIGMVELLAGK